ncbi:MAG TPA: UDP-N-acetylmuramoyl-tripeptide--D-alanyl-D-alanine ligase [Candidatus Paceibacterota bacterium]|nr:UDP-N-acetylmuramoyl-tripeptide--D-alanyl-D-alanine ligase [Candidatus Paceibacterota bacterium]HQM34906.1 UDP-N-acetylmuramoyl-tripeptide--D-alanyl-D-alanine ligase [Candidatus Paceibacterota bacterium]
MKSPLLFNTLKNILRILAQWTLKKYKPAVIGITGSVGKTSTKEAVYTVLKGERNVRRSQGNFNNELGVPLTILGDYNAIRGILFWPKVIFQAIGQLLIFNKKYPEILVLEMAADRPGDIQYLARLARPKIGVITSIGEIPVHVEFYSSPTAVAVEKARLIELLPANGFAILNRDDELVWNLRIKTRAHIISYGFKEDADIQIINFEYKFDENEFPEGITFKIQYGNVFVPFRLFRVMGKPQIYSIAAAVAVGIVFGINLVKISDYLANYQPPDHRMQIIKGIKNSVILDDCYNASPLSMKAALETLGHFTQRRRVAILGDMLELGKYTTEAHEEIGKEVIKKVDFLICVGSAARLIAESAIKHGFDKNKVLVFNNSESASKIIKKEISSNDAILIKGSHAMQLEKIVEELKK